MKTQKHTLPANLSCMTEAEFFNFASQMDNMRMERTKQGTIIIMPPIGLETGRKNGNIFGYLFIWNITYSLGVVFDSSSGYTLADTSVRSPDASWLRQASWDSLPTEDRKKFAPICPEFVVELMSESDELAEAQLKMGHWRDNGCLLGWLINPKTEKVYIYRAGSLEVEEITGFEQILSGENILPAFAFDLRKLL